MASSLISIQLAVYASNAKGIDVTSVVQDMVANGNDDILVNDDSFGDPDPGATKFFLVWYTSGKLNNGNLIGLAAEEHDTVDLVPSGTTPYYSTLPQEGPVPSSFTPFVVERAVYGTPRNGFDVTAICQALLNQNGLLVQQPPSNDYTIAIENGTFGGDPDVGATKYFAMQYRVGTGTPLFIGGQEKTTLSVPQS